MNPEDLSGFVEEQHSVMPDVSGTFLGWRLGTRKGPG
jgi:hypothetical protein